MKHLLTFTSLLVMICWFLFTPNVRKWRVVKYVIFDGGEFWEICKDVSQK